MDDAFIAIHFSLELLKKYLKTVARYSLRLSFDISSSLTYVQHCPKPIDRDEEELQQKEDGTYIQGKVAFIEDNPGRQSMTGSFNPIDEDEWGEQVYVPPAAQLFHAIITHDQAVVQRLLKAEDGAVNVSVITSAVHPCTSLSWLKQLILLRIPLMLAPG